MTKKLLQSLLDSGQRIAERIKEHRLRLELTQEALAKKAGLGRSALVHYEQGNAIPGSPELIKLAYALEVSPNALLSGSETFFPSDETRHELAKGTDEELMARVAIGFQAADRPFREAVSALLMAHAQTKLTKRQFAELRKSVRLVPALMAEHVPVIEALADDVERKAGSKLKSR